MDNKDIAITRLFAHQLVNQSFKLPGELLRYMGAMQSQDYAMAKWAIGSRIQGLTDQDIEESLNNAEIIRTHVLRPTWHFVSSEDIRWMLMLTAPNINKAVSSMNKKLELDKETLSRCKKIIGKVLRGLQLTREEIMRILQQEGIRTDDNRSSHIMLHAELEGLVCNGNKRDKQFTYALLDERISETLRLSKEEALAKLSMQYFTSHGPATINDFAWWSGLTMKDARNGLELIKHKLHSERVDSEDYFWFDMNGKSGLSNNSILFLSSFDEYVVSYKNRNASLSSEYAGNAITGNGIFKPIIVVNGEIIGIWKRTLKKDNLIAEVIFFNKAKKLSKEEITKGLTPYCKFLNLNLILQ